MADSIYAHYPPAISSEQEEYLVQSIKDWSIQHGLAVRPGPSTVSEDFNSHHILATNAPVTLFPSPFPQPCFKHARSIQKAYNKLYAAIANDEDWLEGIVKELMEVDDFIAKLWKVHLDVKKEGYAHDLSLGLFRSDYMLHWPESAASPSLKQVEFNTISSSFGGLSSLVTDLHTHLATFPNPWTPLAYPPHPLFTPFPAINTSPPLTKPFSFPPRNYAIYTLCTTLAAAHSAYGPSKSSPPLPLCIIFLVQPSERNIFDQLALSTYLHLNFNIPCFRLATTSILASTTIPAVSTNSSRPLLYHPPSLPTNPYEATTIYFRALYAPSEYTNPALWAARLHLERSAAIKCPTILTQLAGCKKVQQVLTSTTPDHLAHFLPTIPPTILADLRSTFAPQYALSATSSEGLDLALNPATAANHVLKPQREGGGNNIYRSAIPAFLASIPEKDHAGYILMELIHPPAAARNSVLKSDGCVVSGEVISELGVFGGCLWRKTAVGEGKEVEMLYNEEGGYLLRTKGKESDEGGVAAGFGALDSIVLYDT